MFVVQVAKARNPETGKKIKLGGQNHADQIQKGNMKPDGSLTEEGKKLLKETKKAKKKKK